MPLERTSVRNPPSTYYRRPKRRKFYVWRCRFNRNAWRWCCTLCEPPSHGYRTVGGWERIVNVSLPRHMNSRKHHHAFVQRNLTTNGYAISLPHPLP